MRYERTDRAAADFRRLSDDEKALFRRAARAFNEACDDGAGRAGRSWPGALRVKAVVGAPGVWEMTWSFSGPDGRATWEWVTIEVDDVAYPAVRWRRIGGHEVFRNP